MQLRIACRWTGCDWRGGGLFGLRVARFLVGASKHRGSEGFGATHLRVGSPPRLLRRQLIRNSVKRLEHFVFQTESN